MKDKSEAITNLRRGDLLPHFKIMHRSDVKMLETKSDNRWYYFDEDVDIVVVMGSKSHVEPPHLHTENMETYFVIRGKLILDVEGERISLEDGDMVKVKPGTCHHFETFDEEVVFLAIKKEPGLNDKKLC